MKRMISTSPVLLGMTIGLLTTTFLIAGSRNASAQSAQCYAQFQGQTMYMFNGSFDSCVRTIRAAAGSAQYGIGTWGNYGINTDANGNTYVDAGDGQWQYVGVVQNVSGSVGSLQDRCVRGDVQACNQWSNQLDNAMQQMQQLYPPGWSQ